MQHIPEFLLDRFRPSLPTSTPLAARLAFPFETLVARLLYLAGIVFPGFRPLIGRVQRRCRRHFQRLDRLILLWTQGRLPAAPAARVREAGRAGGARIEADWMRLMRARGHRTGRGWLVSFFSPAALATCRFEAWLEDDEARRFLDECPQASGMMRPIFRMLDVRHPWLDADRAARKARRAVRRVVAEAPPPAEASAAEASAAVAPERPASPWVRPPGCWAWVRAALARWKRALSPPLLE